jgi:hypothetical protein
VRQLYTDNEEILFQAVRPDAPEWHDGISEPDLTDRGTF